MRMRPDLSRPLELNAISGEIVDSSMHVHSELGPGLLESAYRACVAYELRSRGLAVETEVALPIMYRGVRIGIGYRLDLLVERAVVVELKVVRHLHPIHEAQLLSYLRISGKQLGLLINFHVRYLKDGIKRMLHNHDLR
jgi:GxxExxY protein